MDISASTPPTGRTPVDEIGSAYARYGPALVRKAERMLGARDEALDIVHELFAGFLERAPKSLDLPYLYTAVNHRCLNRIRDGQTRNRLLERHGPEQEALRSIEGQVLDRAVLLRLLRELDDRDAQVLALSFFDGLNQIEVGKALGITRRTVYERITQIRAQALRYQGDTA